MCKQSNLHLLMTTLTERPQHWGAQFCHPPACWARWLCEGCLPGDQHGTTGLPAPFPKEPANEHSYQRETKKRGLFHLLTARWREALPVTPQVSNPLVQNRSLLFQTKVKRDFNWPELTSLSELLWLRDLRSSPLLLVNVSAIDLSKLRFGGPLPHLDQSQNTFLKMT